MKISIRKIDGEQFRQLLIAGFSATIADKEYINKINVFPVPDADTGTNLAMTFDAILAEIGTAGNRAIQLPDLLTQVADLAVDSGRGNSGAIMAQFFEGFRVFTGSRRKLDASQLSMALAQAAEQSRAAMSHMVEGTLPTVLTAYAKAWQQLSRKEKDLKRIFSSTYDIAQQALLKTTDQLPVLKQAGVVDAGAQGFVDLLTGINGFIKNGCQHPDGYTAIEHEDEDQLTALVDNNPHSGNDLDQHFDSHSDYRFCTECIVVDNNLIREDLISALNQLDCDSVVVAGTAGKARVHLHTNNPAEIFLLCEDFGQVLRQKADDMKRQHRLQSHKGQVTVVFDSAADIDADEVDRLHMHMVPVRLILGDTEYLDKVSISPADYYQRIKASNSVPKTSQPPSGDYRRQFELLTSHGYKVIYVGLSAKLSGTLQAGITASERFDKDQIICLDSHNASTGEGLVASYAAEAAEQGLDLNQVLDVTSRIRERTITYALITDLSWGVRGGRIPPFALWLAEHLRLSPLIRNSPVGELKVFSVLLGRKNLFVRFANKIARKLDTGQVYRIVIAHCDALENAKTIRRALLSKHPGIYSCQVIDIGPAIGAHIGPGGIAVGIQDYISPTDFVSPESDQARPADGS